MYILPFAEKYVKKKAKSYKFSSYRKGVIFIYQSTKLAECQKEFLFNSKYGYDECHPNYKSLNYHCKKTGQRIEENVDNITDEQYFELNQNIYETIYGVCNKCCYNN